MKYIICLSEIRKIVNRQKICFHTQKIEIMKEDFCTINAPHIIFLLETSYVYIKILVILATMTNKL